MLTLARYQLLCSFSAAPLAYPAPPQCLGSPAIISEIHIHSALSAGHTSEVLVLVTLMITAGIWCPSPLGSWPMYLTNMSGCIHHPWRVLCPFHFSSLPMASLPQTQVFLHSTALTPLLKVSFFVRQALALSLRFKFSSLLLQSSEG